MQRYYHNAYYYLMLCRCQCFGFSNCERAILNVLCVVTNCLFVLAPSLLLDPLCITCHIGDTPTVRGLINYTQFCSSGMSDKPAIGIDGAIGAADISLSARYIADQRLRHQHQHDTKQSSPSTSTIGVGHILLDVRVPEQYNIASLPGAINIPLRDLRKRLPELQALIANERERASLPAHEVLPVYVLCRRGILSTTISLPTATCYMLIVVMYNIGIDSMTATRLLRSTATAPTAAAVTTSTIDTNANGTDNGNGWQAYNMSGGLLAWTRHVDPSFPVY
jgi:rhodanese-related sulfurtransferase